MPYTLTLIRTDRTDLAPRHINIARWLFWLIVLFFVTLPITGFFIATRVIAPSYMKHERTVSQQKISNLQQEIKVLSEEKNTQTDQIEQLQNDISYEREQRAAFDARVAIGESARTESMSKLQQLEAENEELQQSLEFYQSFIKPVTERDVLQCYNITTKYSKGKLTYSVNFLKTERKNKKKINAKVKFRILAGGEVVNLSEGEAGKADHERDLNLSESYVMKGSMKVKIPSEGLRIVDIKAYDKKTNEVISHCWKAI